MTEIWLICIFIVLMIASVKSISKIKRCRNRVICYDTRKLANITGETEVLSKSNTVNHSNGKPRQHDTREISRLLKKEPQLKELSQQDYNTKRKYMLDEASKAGSEGNHGLEQELNNRVSKLDEKYAAQCERSFDRKVKEDALNVGE